MRDLDRWKDKVELQLDGRQIFFLFFGSAVCACLIFVLGVVVGRRVESQRSAQAQPAAEDPLAVLDELGNAEEGLTFHSALVKDKDKDKDKAAKDKARAERGDRPEAAPEREDEGARAQGKPEGKPEGKLDGKAEARLDGEGKAEPEGGKKPAKAEGKADGKADGKAEGKLDGKAAAKADGKPEGKDDKKAALALKADKADKEKSEAKAAAEKDKAKGHFTLQLSAFATKGEASDFMRRLRDAGYKPYLIESMIPGKGLMYRVRLGDYVSRDSALTAKSDFERKQKMVAYVAKQ